MIEKEPGRRRGEEEEEEGGGAASCVCDSVCFEGRKKEKESREMGEDCVLFDHISQLSPSSSNHVFPSGPHLLRLLLLLLVCRRLMID